MYKDIPVGDLQIFFSLFQIRIVIFIYHCIHCALNSVYQLPYYFFTYWQKKIKITYISILDCTKVTFTWQSRSKNENSITFVLLLYLIFVTNSDKTVKYFPNIMYQLSYFNLFFSVVKACLNYRLLPFPCLYSFFCFCRRRIVKGEMIRLHQIQIT